jgi:LEA14-like dessication related protein
MGRGTITLGPGGALVRTSRLAFAFPLLLAACAPALKPPALQVEGLKKGTIGITGAKLDVVFGVRNPNPQELAVEKMEFDLVLNGHRVGRGYVGEPFVVGGFGGEKVISTVDVSYLSVPDAVKAVLNDDEVRAEVHGTFYVRRGGGLVKLAFDSDARISLGREN